MENPWTLLPEHAPYVLPQDRPFIEEFNSRRAKPETRVELRTEPQPFLGDPRAPVVFLLLSPGAINIDERPTSDFERDCMRKNLRHEVRTYPFFPLHPALRRSGGSEWWRPRLKEPLAEFGDARVAARICTVQYFPYWSKAYGGVRVPSQEYGFHLVSQAMDREALIVLMVGRRQWYEAVPEFCTYPHCYHLQSTQSTAISRRNCPDGYRELEHRLQ